MEVGKWKVKTNGLKTKERAFEYLCWLLLDWWKEQNPEKEVYENDLSVLKVLKLSFFVTAIDATTKTHDNKDNDGLLHIFDNWQAMPYGHIEQDMYNIIRNNKGQFSFFKIDNSRITLQKVPDWL